jgi:hypothetical protein
MGGGAKGPYFAKGFEGQALLRWMGVLGYFGGRELY